RMVILGVMGLVVVLVVWGIGKGVKMLSEMKLRVGFVVMVLVVGSGGRVEVVWGLKEKVGS
ncbi:BCCT family transporter, partial [Neisseria sicca]|uniref:BCCT family transporter n=1 Tax=Neisseria sicca TaxID=490 RepID=UPI0011BD01AC